MHKHLDGWSHSSDRPSPIKTLLSRFLLSILASLLVIAAAVAAMIPQLTYNKQQAHAASIQNTAQDYAKLQLDPDAETLDIYAKIFDAPPNTPLVMNVHDQGNCTGPILFTLQATSDDQGHAFTTMTFDDQQDTTISSNWVFNVQDTTRQATDGKSLSIACGPIQVDASGLTGQACLSTVQSPNPGPVIQSTTQGMTTLHLDMTVHTLSIQALLFNAPPNIPLVMNLHDEGSCTGPILFTLQTTSDPTGHASAMMTFGDQDDTTIASDWVFNVQDTTQQAPDGKSLSIACSPVQVIDPTIGFAKLDPVQQDLPMPTPTPSTGDQLTQSATQGLTTLQLDPNAHILTTQTNIFGAPPNTPLIMHIHGNGNCMGPILFTLQMTSNASGFASTTTTFNDQLDTTIPKNWFFNVHDATRQAPDGKPLSIACGPIQVVDPSDLIAYAPLSPVQPSPVTTTATPPVITPQSTTQGLTILFLNASVHILNVLAHVVGAPPNTSLALDIHGDGSCTGPTLFMMAITSSITGDVNAIIPFNDQQDTAIPNNWFLTVHDSTKLGPDGQSRSIACGPIQTPGLIGLAQLSPVQ
jgi:Cu/Zn superoxide dismutase